MPLYLTVLYGNGDGTNFGGIEGDRSERNFAEDTCSPRAVASELQMCANHRCSIAHDFQAEPGRRLLILRQTFSIIADFQFDFPASSPQSDADFRRLRMFDGIVDRLLRDSIKVRRRSIIF